MERRFNVPNRALIPVLVPMFLIISSSVYPAILSSMENKEMLIIAEATAQLRGDSDREADADTHYSYRSQIRATSPTPTDSSPANLSLSNPNPASSSSPHSMKTDTNSIPMNSEDDIQLKRGTYTSSYHERLRISGSYTPSSPTSSDPSSEAPSFTSAQSGATPMIVQQDDIITPTAIDAGDLVHVLWRDDAPGDLDIFYKRDGADFDPTTINLSNTANGSFNQKIAVSGSNVHVIWTDVITLANNDIFYRRSTDGGATFGPTINLSNNGGRSDEPAIAVSGNNVHVVWDDDTSGNFEILYKRSTNGGASFTEPTKNLSDNAGTSGSPAIAVSGSNVHVVWGDDTSGNFDILYRRSINGGSTFPNIIKNLSDNAGSSFSPAIAISGNNVHVVWEDNTPDPDLDILYRRSLNGGDTFPNIIKNLSSNAGTSEFPAIAVSGNNVHVVWADSFRGIIDIFYRRSLDGGTTFHNIIKDFSNTGFSSQPAIAIASNNVYVVWHDIDITFENFEILYITSADNGATFPTVTNLSTNAGSSETPAIAIS